MLTLACHALLYKLKMYPSSFLIYSLTGNNESCLFLNTFKNVFAEFCWNEIFFKKNFNCPGEKKDPMDFHLLGQAFE